MNFSSSMVNNKVSSTDIALKSLLIKEYWDDSSFFYLNSKFFISSISPKYEFVIKYLQIIALLCCNPTFPCYIK